MVLKAVPIYASDQSYDLHPKLDGLARITQEHHLGMEKCVGGWGPDTFVQFSGKCVSFVEVMSKRFVMPCHPQ